MGDVVVVGCGSDDSSSSATTTTAATTTTTAPASDAQLCAARDSLSTSVQGLATAVTGMAQLYYNQLMGGGTTTSYHCYDATNNCMNENLGTGNQDAIAAMLAGCVPRH